MHRFSRSEAVDYPYSRLSSAALSRLSGSGFFFTPFASHQPSCASKSSVSVARQN